MTIRVEYVPDPETQRTVHQVPVVHFYEDDTVLIVHQKAFIRIPVKDIRFSRWEY